MRTIMHPYRTVEIATKLARVFLVFTSSEFSSPIFLANSNAAHALYITHFTLYILHFQELKQNQPNLSKQKQ